MADEYKYTTCWKCKEVWGVRAELIEIARRSGTPLHCPFGHAGYWQLGKTDKELLQEQLDEERRERQAAQQRIAYFQDQAEHEKRRANGYKGHATRITKRAKAGVCPCCNRTFKQLAQHMANKHPQFTPLALEERPPEGATVQ